MKTAAPLLALSLVSTVLAVSAFAADKPAAGKALPGQGIYKDNCAACHGDAGKPAMPKAPDFSSKAYAKKVTDAKLIKATTDGVGTAMPAFKGSLTPEKVKQVVAYVRTLAK